LSVINNLDTLVQITDHIWLTRPNPNIDTPQDLNVCYRLDNGDFAALDRVSRRQNGTYFKKDKELGSIDSQPFMDFIGKLEGLQTSQAVNISIDDMSKQELFATTCNVFRDTKSIKKTAATLGISEQKARKILITEGLYTCELLKKINAMLSDGLALPAIGEQLGISVKQIRTYLPYDEGAGNAS